MTDIKRLLNKTDWTGRELGMLELYNMAITFKQTISGEDQKPIFDRSQFQKMVNGIRDPEQGRQYNIYISVHEWIVLAYNIAQTQYQQAQLHFTVFEGYVSKAIIAEDVFQYVAKLPAIMTQSQYDRLRSERIEAHFKTESGEELYSNVLDLIRTATEYYVSKLEKEPRKPNPLKALRKKYIAQPVKSKLVLDQYNGITGRGYYTLDDGRRSDQMTSEEWQAALTTPTAKHMIDSFDKTYKDGDGENRFIKALAMKRAIDKAKVIFNGGTEEEADRKQSEREYKEGIATHVTWHDYTEPPEDLSKWDIIEDSVLLLELYPASIDGGDPSDNMEASIKDFYSEFKDLAEIMLKDIDSRYNLKLSKLKLSEWATTKLSWRQLYDMDFYGERAKAESDLYIFDGNRRALFNGLAIVRPTTGWSASHFIDKESGDYKAPELTCSIENASLEAFFSEATSFADNVDMIIEARHTLMSSYYYVVCFNYIMSRIAVEFDVAQLEVFTLPIQILARRISALNDLVPILYKQIKSTDYGDKDLQAKKLQVLRDYFQPIEYDKLQVPDNIKQKIDEALKDPNTFKAQSSLLLSYMNNMPDLAGEEAVHG